MGERDSPLKLLARQYIQDIASWLLAQDVAEAEELNIELATETPRADLVFLLKLADTRSCLFHIEFQGRRSRPDMPRRQLNYLSRLALQHDWPFVLESFVLYIEKYAGSRDVGYYQIDRLDGSLALGWHYTPVHLWRQPAEPVLAIGKPGLIPLMGLMHIQAPEKTVPEMVNWVRREPDDTRRQTLFSSLLALMGDKEHVAMLEKLIDPDELMLDTPFLRRLREQAQAEGRAEGRAEGIQLGQIAARHDDILDAIAVRLKPSVLVYREIERRLAQVDDPELLRQMLIAALQAEDITIFEEVLSEILGAKYANRS